MFLPGFWYSKVRRQSLLLAACWAIVVTISSPTAFSASTILSTGFESPYVTGLLQGQPVNPPQWVTAGSGGATATVQTSVVQSGAQAVRVDKPATSGSSSTDRRWSIPVSGYPTQRFVIVDWDMRVQETVSTIFGPFFGVETYDAAPSPRVLGTLGVDASSGDVLYQAQGSGAITETGTVVSFNQWNHFRIVLDFGGTGTTPDTYRGYVNGNLVASSGFVDSSFGLNDFTDADIATFALGSSAEYKALGGTAYFDNFVVRDGLSGDYDIDGDVDNADYTRWRNTFGSGVSPAGNLADGNSNAVVDAGDYVIWRRSLGGNVASASGLSGAVVPEPQTWLMVLGFMSALPSAIRRRT